LGGRIGSFTDPFGYMWSVATHKEDVSPGEMQKRAKAWQTKQQQNENA
jgi:PhnB protein